MSVQATSWAFEQGDLGITEKFLLVAIANIADAAGVAYPGQATLARYCATTRETVSRNLGKLEEAGFIARRERRRANGSRTSDWIVLAPKRERRGEMLDAEYEEYPSAIADLARRSLDDSSRDPDGQLHVTPEGGPEPPVEPSANGVSSARVKIGGKPVVPESWELTQAILAEFNRQTERDMRLLTSAGEASEAAKRIYGRVRKYPDLTIEDHKRIIANTIASRWWDPRGTDTGKPAIGVVYGPNVFEDNISRHPSATVGNVRGGQMRHTPDDSGVYDTGIEDA